MPRYDRSPPRRRDEYRDRRSDRDDRYHGRDRDRDRDYRRDDRHRRDDRDYRSRGSDRDRDLFPSGRDKRADDRLSRDEDYPPRRERSRDRKRVRSRSPDHSRLDDRRRDDARSSYDGSRRGSYHRDDSRESKRLRRDKEDHEPAMTAAEAEDLRKKKERQARLAEWKKKQEEKKKLESSTNGSPAAQSEAPETSTGKFDPKAIAKRASAAKSRLISGNNTLEGDLAIPDKTKSTTATPTNGTNTADKVKKSSQSNDSSISFANNKPIKARLGRSQTTGAKPAGQGPNIDMSDDETEHRLEKLSAPKFDNMNDTALANPEEVDEGGDSDEFEDEDPERRAAEAKAARERSNALLGRSESATEAVDDADKMDDVQPTNGVTPAVPAEASQNGAASASPVKDAVMAEEDDIDPLDAFMMGLETQDSMPKKKGRNTQERKLITSDDEDNQDAVGDEEDLAAAAVLAKKKKRKEIPIPDHSKIAYEPFRKDFWVEPEEIRDMDDEELKSLRFELDNIRIHGKHPLPRPCRRFAQFGLGGSILEVIRTLNFEAPTPVQAQAIPAIMSGRDVIAIAKTGSGKTVAFLLPMFRHIKDQRPLGNAEGPIAIILAPTRELVSQIHKECQQYLKPLGLRAIAAYGGIPISEQINVMKRGAEIVISTPGRLVDLALANNGRVMPLNRCTYVVMDEADRMFDMGFEPSITRFLHAVRPDRQCVLFSATLPKKLDNIASRALLKPLHIQVGERSAVAKEITQVIEIMPQDNKFERCIELLGRNFADDNDSRALLFVERQESADMLMIQLQKYGYKCGSIHAGREQIDRDIAIEQFKKGKLGVLTATSVAARGLDVQQLKLVINYDVPNHLEDYVHRAGRTGRAGNTGTAVTFITPEQDMYAGDVVKALQRSEQPVPEDLKKMATSFEEKVKAGQAKKVGSGFGGKGLDSMNAKHDAELRKERKAYKGLNPDDQYMSDEEEDKRKKRNEDGEGAGQDQGLSDDIKVRARGEAAEEVQQQPSPKQTQPAAEAEDKTSSLLTNEADIQIHKKEQAAQPSGNLTKLQRAQAVEARLRNKLGSRGAKQNSNATAIDAGEFAYEMPINDLPQKARWAVTNRTNVAKVLENVGDVSITTKGRYYGPNDKVGDGPDDQPKMYILIEAGTELKVKQAYRELKALANEGIISAAEAEARAPVPQGRFTI